jgi:hypothetical protein
MKKNFLSEELDSMKYLFGYKRGKVISEQTMTTYYKGADGKVGTLSGPQALPAGATAINQQEYNTAMSKPQTGTQVVQQPSTTQTTTVVQPTTTQTTTVAPQQLRGTHGTDYIKQAQTLLGVTSDGKFGPKTLDALKAKLGSSTTATTTVKPAEASTENSQTSTTQTTQPVQGAKPVQGPQPSQQSDKGDSSSVAP